MRKYGVLKYSYAPQKNDTSLSDLFPVLKVSTVGNTIIPRYKVDKLYVASVHYFFLSHKSQLTLCDCDTQSTQLQF